MMCVVDNLRVMHSLAFRKPLQSNNLGLIHRIQSTTIKTVLFLKSNNKSGVDK